jgi:hypothetical protein
VGINVVFDSHAEAAFAYSAAQDGELATFVTTQLPWLDAYATIGQLEFNLQQWKLNYAQRNSVPIDWEAVSIGVLGLAAVFGPDAVCLFAPSGGAGSGLGLRTGSYRNLNSAGIKDAHHVIQDAAMRDLPGYSSDFAPAIELPGPSTLVGSPHYLATQVQRRSGGGTYADERRIAEDALHAAGLSDNDIRRVLEWTDAYFAQLGVTSTTQTRIPGNRR